MCGYFEKTILAFFFLFWRGVLIVFLFYSCLIFKSMKRCCGYTTGDIVGVGKSEELSCSQLYSGCVSCLLSLVGVVSFLLSLVVFS